MFFRAECFGLLGVNGAGKTTTFKMLTGDLSISDGDAFLRGISLKSNMTKAKQFMGYCPQFDGLLDDLTGYETLAIFALIRGIRCRNISTLVEQMADNLGFMQQLNKKVRTLSGGNKRKLSTAIAFIGNSFVVYLGNFNKRNT